MCVLAKGKHISFAAATATALGSDFELAVTVVWKWWCFHVFSSMETIDHPVWVLKWSLSWGLYSAFRSFKDLDDDDSGKLDPNEVGPWGFCLAMWGYSGWNVAEGWVFNGFFDDFAGFPSNVFLLIFLYLFPTSIFDSTSFKLQ